jgi:hypothetical protein
MQFGEWRRRLLVGIGVGWADYCMPASTVAIIASPDDITAATGAMTLVVRVLGSSIGY